LTPLLGLYAQNVEVTPFSAIVPPALYLFLGSFALWILGWILLRDRYRAGLAVSTLVLFLVVLWGVLEDVIRRVIFVLAVWSPWTFYAIFGLMTVLVIGSIAWRARGNRDVLRSLVLILIPTALAGFAVAAFLLTPVFGRRAAWMITAYLLLTGFSVRAVLRYSGDLRVATRSANWFAAILVALYVAVVGYNRVPSAGIETVDLAITAHTQEAGSPAPQSPDIYLVALDGYARGDILASDYGYNNLAFEGALRDLGFTIPEKSQSNYTHPVYSIAACLNMDYLSAMVPEEKRASSGVGTVLQLYHENRVCNFLREQGYEVVAFSPGMQSLEPRIPYVRCISPSESTSEFEIVLADRTAVSRIMEVVYFARYDNPAYWRFAYRSTRILAALDGMPKLAGEQSDKPRFVLAHLSLPDPPFLFTRDGDPAQPFGPGSLSIHQGFRGEEAEFRTAYLDQLYFTNQMLRKALEGIVRNSTRPAVVVLVSSRGAPLLLQRESGTGSQRYASLIAVRFPDGTAMGKDKDIYATITPVNLFRVVFNRLFDTRLPLIEDRQWLVSDERPLEASPAPAE
ncbi:MAG: hypothetical protein IT364_18355, partial [Candidatus Hydrogenedentes bacterium]|nr:hypothetical protein [Candidatus Hydrogenedentota bacterium]